MGDGTELSVIIHRVSFVVNPNSLKISEIRGSETAGLTEQLSLTAALDALIGWTTGVTYPEFEKITVNSSGDSERLVYVRREFERQEVVRRKLS